LIVVPRPTDTSQDDFRDRAARTKRLRSRTALITAADATFSARGWTNTRIEDVAALAGVSTATAYNHFPSKHALLAAVYAPYLHTLVAQAKHAITDRRPIVAALADQVHALARLSWHHRELTAAFSAAILDYTVRVGRAPDPEDRTDPRNLTPLIQTLSPLIEHGQVQGQLQPFPPAAEISDMLTNLLLLRSINRKDERPHTTAVLLLTLLFGALRAEQSDAEGGTQR
jgi:AcrR family transcriptional regulator